MITKSGLIGLYQSPTTREQVSSVYMIADGETSSLFILMLFPGAYLDANEIASLQPYHNIFIVPVSLEGLYLSDAYRLALDLMKTKQHVHILHPKKFAMHVHPLVRDCLLKGSPDNTTAFVYGNGFIAFNWGINEAELDEPIYQIGFYDIYTNFDNKRFLFCPFEVNKSRILELLQNDNVDYVYLPYAKSLFGSDNFLTVQQDENFAEYKDKIVAFGFRNDAEAALCWEMYPNSFPITIRWMFLNSSIIMSKEIDYVVVTDRNLDSNYYDGHERPFPLEKYVEKPTDDSDVKIPVSTLIFAGTVDSVEKLNEISDVAEGSIYAVISEILPESENAQIHEFVRVNNSWLDIGTVTIDIKTSEIINETEEVTGQ